MFDNSDSVDLDLKNTTAVILFMKSVNRQNFLHICPLVNNISNFRSFIFREIFENVGCSMKNQTM